MALDAKYTTLPNLNSEGLGTPINPVGHEMGDCCDFLGLVDVIKFKNPRITLSTLFATFFRHVFECFDSGGTTYPSFIRSSNLSSLCRSLFWFLRFRSSCSIGVEIWVNLLGVWGTCTLLASALIFTRAVSFNLWIGSFLMKLFERFLFAAFRACLKELRPAVVEPTYCSGIPCPPA